jgi:PAS domain S-box-containing protein
MIKSANKTMGRKKSASAAVGKKAGKPQERLFQSKQISPGSEVDPKRYPKLIENLEWELSVNKALAQLSSAMLTPSFSITEISKIVLEHAKQLTGSRFGYVGYIEPETGHLVCPTLTKDVLGQCQMTNKGIVFKKFRGPWGWVLTNRKSMISNAVAEDPRSTGLPGGHIPIRKFLSAPSIAGEKLVGQVALANSERDYTPKDLLFVERLANIYALAIQRKQTEEAVGNLARFPGENPNPVLRVSKSGIVLYGNNSSKPLLAAWGCKANKPLPLILRKKIIKAIESGRSVNNEVECGEQIFSVTFAPVKDLDYVNIYGLDITDRKAVEEALKNSEERYSLAQKAAEIGSWDWDLKTNDLEWSDTIEPMFGFRTGQFGKTYEAFLKCVHPQDCEKIIKGVNDCIESRKEYDVEHRIIWPNGVVRWISEIGNVIRDQDGEPVRMLGIVRDITEHKQTEQALRNSEERFRALIEQASEALFLIRMDGTFMDANQRACEALGYSRKELLQLSVPDINPAYPKKHFDKLIESFTPGVPVTLEAVHKRKDGTTFPVEIRTGLIDLHGEYHILSFARDITRRKQAERQMKGIMAELQRSNSELEQFGYIISHDLQEPLRMVTSYLQLIRKKYKEKLDPDAQDFIWYAVDGATRMHTLIKDLLAYSRAGAQREKIKPVNFADVLKRVKSNLQLMIEDNKAIVTNDPLPVIKGDGTQLIQLMQNLIANAIKFKGQKPPRIHISVEKNDDEYVFSIRDNGIGIDQAHEDLIFMVFQRLHPRDEYPGTGIGLAICKKIVEQHKGSITFESKPDEGATFIFTIPHVIEHHLTPDIVSQSESPTLTS